MMALSPCPFSLRWWPLMQRLISAGRVTSCAALLWNFWPTGGAIAMGTGICSMHYIGMLAFRMGIPIEYDWPTVLLSLLAAILASAIALFVVSRREMGMLRAIGGKSPAVWAAELPRSRHPHWHGGDADGCNVHLFREAGVAFHRAGDRDFICGAVADVLFPHANRWLGCAKSVERTGDGCRDSRDALHRHGRREFHACDDVRRPAHTFVERIYVRRCRNHAGYADDPRFGFSDGAHRQAIFREASEMQSIEQRYQQIVETALDAFIGTDVREPKPRQGRAAIGKLAKANPAD